MTSGVDPGAADLSARIRARARELGFESAGIARVEPLEARAHYEAWLAAGRHADMLYLASERHRARRADPERVLPGLSAVISVALCHPPQRDPGRDRRLGRIARYAAGEDYHRVMRDLLGKLAEFVEQALPGARVLHYADTGAILERGWGERAGLGWTGKHTGLIGPRIGSFFLLGELLVDRPLAADAPYPREHCGTCTRCIAACPTRAIVAPHVLDAGRCISYLTIERRGPIPRELRAPIGDWVFGCDVCQEVCPWNRFAPAAREARLHARELAGWTLERFLELDAAGFDTLFAKSPIRRARREGFLRNVCIALGNRGAWESAPALLRALEHDVSPLVRGHAAWALERIVASSGRANGPTASSGSTAVRVALSRAERDPDPFVREEAMTALAAIGTQEME